MVLALATPLIALAFIISSTPVVFGHIMLYSITSYDCKLRLGRDVCTVCFACQMESAILWDT